MRIVILDDYQCVAKTMADWSGLHADVSVSSIHIPERAALVERLRGASVVVAMRERTPFPADLLASLPDLRLLVTTGMVNRAIDLDAARACGITVCGTPGSGYGASELAFGLVLALARGIPVNAGVKLGRGAAQNWATLGLRETSARERRPVSRALHVAGG